MEEVEEVEGRERRSLASNCSQGEKIQRAGEDTHTQSDRHFLLVLQHREQLFQESVSISCLLQSEQLKHPHPQMHDGSDVTCPPAVFISC